jgi:endonuclease/exonuclease/phosphatase (EEP) superfamily protein YafD
LTRFLHVNLAAVATLLVLASFLPIIQTEWWVIRLLDFPRLQIGLALIVLGCVLAFFLRRAPWTTGALLAGMGAAVAGHAVTLWPYRPGGENFLAGCPTERSLSVMVAKVLLGNRTVEPLLATVERERPDLLLAMETDEWWDEALRPLKRAMPFSIEKITGSYYGIHFFSRLPLVDPTIRFLVDGRTPSVVTGVTLRNGERVDFVGVHPKPPQPWQSSLGRDAELYAAALLLRDRKEPGLLAGDLNATPWEEAVDRSRRIAGLIDPRRGYGYVPTFSATSAIESWPLDHIFHEGGFATVSLKRLDAFGSDHYPYIVRLCRQADGGATPPTALPEDFERARGIIARASVRASPETVRSEP